MSVVLIDKNIIGGSSSGRSAGLLTPDSELELHQLVRRYGIEGRRGYLGGARVAASSASSQTIQKYDIHAGLLHQDSLFLGLGKGGTSCRRGRNANAARASGSPTSASTTSGQLKGILGAQGYTAGHPLRRNLRHQSAA